MRKLTEKQKYDKVIGKIIARIKNMENDYAPDFVRIACTRYAEASRKKMRLEIDIEEKEKELAELKRTSK